MRAIDIVVNLYTEREAGENSLGIDDQFLEQIRFPPDLRRGVPLGMSDGRGWEADRIDLPETWSLMLYTDGIVEGRDPHGPDGRWGVEGLVEALGSTRLAPAETPDLLDGLIRRAEELNGGELTDDVAVLLLHCDPVSDA